MMSRPRREEYISLSSRAPYLDKPSSHIGSDISLSEPLLEDESQSAKRPRRSKWRTLASLKILSGIPREFLGTRDGKSEKMLPGKRKRSRLCLKLGFGILLVLGVIQLFSLIGSLIVVILPDGIHRIVESWGRPGHIGVGLSSWPTDFSQDIIPIPCHSHNDYWRTVPLYSAIEAGCIGVEADIWLFSEELYVGHSIASLTPNRTLNSLYINPLLDILERQNPVHTLLPDRDSQMKGVFDTNPEQSLVLLIDFKTSGKTLWPYVHSALEPLRNRNYLTRANGSAIIPGPITVVGTGNTPFDLVDADEHNPQHDIFFDAPLEYMYEGPAGESIPPELSHSGTPAPEADESENLSSEISAIKRSSEKRGYRRSDQEGQGKSGTTGGSPDLFNTGNSFYASVAFGKAIGFLWNGEFSDHQMDLLRGQIRGAHKRGLKARYWDLPFWPIGLRNHVWDVLVKEGVDLLNVDDLQAATKRDWGKHNGWWKRISGE